MWGFLIIIIMNFISDYFDLSRKKLKLILNYYGQNFFYNKKILDIGCGYSDISGPLHRLGADVLAVDAREENLKIAKNKYEGLKTLTHDLDKDLNFINEIYDIIINIDLICHIKDYEYHLKKICNSTKNLILESNVYDCDDSVKDINIKENKYFKDLSFNGLCSIPSTKTIENILKENGMSFTRIDSSELNSKRYFYDWKEKK